MKKDKLKSLVKAARKTARKDIELRLITELKELAGKLGQDSKKLKKDIEKGSKQLAKKLSRKLKIDKSAILEASNETKAANVLKIPKPAATRKPRTISSRAAEPATRKAPVVKPATANVKSVKKVAVQAEAEKDSTLA